MPARARLRHPESVFAALGDHTRLGLLSSLSRDGPASITRLTAGSGVTRQAVSKHLRVLARAGLVRVSRRGRETLWRLDPARLDEAQRSLDLIAKQWDQALSKLKVFVENAPSGDAEARAAAPRAAGPPRGEDHPG